MSPDYNKFQSDKILCSSQNGWSHIYYSNIVREDIIDNLGAILAELDGGILLGMKRIRTCQIMTRTDEKNISIRRLSATVKADDLWGQEIELATSIQEGNTLQTQLRQYYLRDIPPINARSRIVLAFPLTDDQLIGSRGENVYSLCALIGRFDVPVMTLLSKMKTWTWISHIFSVYYSRWIPCRRWENRRWFPQRQNNACHWNVLSKRGQTAERRGHA